MTSIYIEPDGNNFIVHLDEIDLLLTKKEGNRSYTCMDRLRINTFNNNSNGEMQLSIVHFHMLWNT